MPEDVYSLEDTLPRAQSRVGPKMAHKIVSKFKEDTFRVIEEEPERLTEIKGISERKAQEIYEQFHDKQDVRQGHHVF